MTLKHQQHNLKTKPIIPKSKAKREKERDKQHSDMMPHNHIRCLLISECGAFMLWLHLPKIWSVLLINTAYFSYILASFSSLEMTSTLFLCTLWL